jgi:DNA-binding transcriptional LysR family regulator
MRRKIPSTQALVCFEAAARHQSFTRAGQDLNLTQGAVSRQVAILEEFVGTALFTRTRHGMILTAAGVTYAKDVTSRLNAIERDTAELINRQGLDTDVLISSVPTFATRWLIPQLAILQKQHAELTLHYETRTRPFMFADTGVDAAFFALTPEQVSQWPGTESTLLFTETVIPVCNPVLLKGKTRLHAKELMKYPLLQQATRPDAWRLWFNAQGIEAPNFMAGPRFELFSMQIAAAKAGLGIALVPSFLVLDELEQSQLLRPTLKETNSGYSYYLIRPSNNLTTKTDLIKTWLVDRAKTIKNVVP